MLNSHNNEIDNNDNYDNEYAHISIMIIIRMIKILTMIMSGNPKVNLLVLDVEGAELKVLHTLPWDEVRHYFLI